MSDGLNSTQSKYQKRLNRLYSIIHVLQRSLAERKKYAATTNIFIKKLLNENRISKEELAEFYKKRYEP